MDQQDKSNTNDIRCASRKRVKNVQDSLVPRQGRRLLSRHLMLQQALLAHGVYHDDFEYIEKLGKALVGKFCFASTIQAPQKLL